MNISQLLNEQKQKLKCDNYVNLLWGYLNDKTSQVPSKEDKKIFDLHLPYALNEFLQSCIEKLRHAIRSNEKHLLDDIDCKYLIALIYHGLNSDDYTENVPIYAANVYILVNSAQIQYIDKTLENQSLFHKLYRKCLDVMVLHLDHGREIDFEFLIDIGAFITLCPVNQDIEKFTEILRRLTETNNTEIFKNFDYKITTNKSFLSFYCLHMLVSSSLYDEDVRNEIVATTVISLMKCVENQLLNKSCKLILLANTRKFLQTVLKIYMDCEWFIALFKELSKIYYKNENFVEIISELSKDFYLKLAKRILSEMSSDKTCKLQIVALSMLQNPSSIMEYFERKHLFTSIIRNIILLFGHNDPDVKETALINFETIMNMRDPMIIDITQSFISADPLSEQINTITIFEILKEASDTTWRRKKFNKSFINVSCELFIKCPQYLREDKIEHLELICLKAPPSEFKQCMPALRKLQKFVLINPKVITFVLNVLIQHSCSTSSSATFYIKELFEIVYETTNNDHSSEVAMQAVDVLISPSYNCESVFKKFHDLKLLDNNLLKKLFHKISLNQPKIWKIVNNVLDFINCSTFPQYMDNYFRQCINEHLFLQSFCGDMLSTFVKIIKCKSSTEHRNSTDTEFMRNLGNYLSESVQVHNVPIKYIGLVFQLIKHLHVHTGHSLEWLDELFTELDAKLHEIVLDIRLAENYEREIAYIGEMLLIFDYRLSDRNMVAIRLLLMKHNLLLDIPQIWSNMVILYGKMCMKQPQYIDDCILTLEYALKNGNSIVQHNSITVLYDFCNIHLHYFDPIFPFVLKFLLCKDNYLRYTTGKLLLRLNSEDHLKLKYNHLIVFVLLFADENLKIRNYFRELSKEVFLKKNEQIIAKYFLLIILHLNKHMEHECFKLVGNLEDVEIGEYDKERRHLIYSQLLWKLSQYNQMQLLNQINKEFLTGIITKKIHLSHNVLNVLKDIVYIIKCMSDEDTPDFYENQMKIINKDIAKKFHHIGESSSNFEHNKIVSKLIQVFIQLIQKFSTYNKQLSYQLFHAVIFLTKIFYPNVLGCLKEDGNFRKTMTKLQQFYNDNKSHFKDNTVSSNR